MGGRSGGECGRRQHRHSEAAKDPDKVSFVELAKVESTTLDSLDASISSILISNGKFSFSTDPTALESSNAVAQCYQPASLSLYRPPPTLNTQLDSLYTRTDHATGRRTLLYPIIFIFLSSHRNILPP